MIDKFINCDIIQPKVDMINLIKQILEIFQNKNNVEDVEKLDEKEKQTLSQCTHEELKQNKYLLGEIFIGGLSSNVGNSKIENLWDVIENIEQYAILRKIPNTDWFMDIETGEYYKRAKNIIEHNTCCNITYSANDFEHKSLYVTETIDFILMIRQDGITNLTEMNIDEIKETYKKGFKYSFLKNDEKINNLFE